MLRPGEMAFHVPPDHSSKRALLVGNLTWWTTDQELEDLCRPFGAVQEVRILEDKVNGRSRGWAVVEFEEPDAATRAMKALGGAGDASTEADSGGDQGATVIHGRAILANWALEETLRNLERGPPPNMVSVPPDGMNPHSFEGRGGRGNFHSGPGFPGAPFAPPGPGVVADRGGFRGGRGRGRGGFPSRGGGFPSRGGTGAGRGHPHGGDFEPSGYVPRERRDGDDRGGHERGGHERGGHERDSRSHERDGRSDRGDDSHRREHRGGDRDRDRRSDRDYRDRGERDRRDRGSRDPPGREREPKRRRR